MKRTELDKLSLVKLFENINRKYAGYTAFQIPADTGGFKKFSYRDLGKRSVDVFSTLSDLGINRGDRVAILSESRPEWAIAFFGILSAAGVVVPLDVKLSEKEIQFILNHSGSRCLFVSGEYLPVVDRLRPVLPHLENVILLDDIRHHDEILFSDIKSHKQKEKKRPIYPEDTTVLVYTSGTTGVAKGVELSYENIFFQVRAFSEIIQYNHDHRFLSLLPLSHMLEITGGLIAPLYAGASITYCDTYKPENIMKTMRGARTTCMICVPLVLKLIHDAIFKKVNKLTSLKRTYFHSALRLSKNTPFLGAKIRRAMFRSVHKVFGGYLEGFISGGAPLDEEVERNLIAMGFKILQGYGLTETAPVISVNTFNHHRIGSVGKPLPGVEVKLSKKDQKDRSGEIITRGPHVMKGYHNDPEATSGILKDGWLYTGDIGYFDKDGFLYISGRDKNLIVLGAGKKVFPEEVEKVIGQSEYIKEICVYGHILTTGPKKGHEEVRAVIVPDVELMKTHGISGEKAMKDKLVSEIRRLKNDLAGYKHIKDFVISFNELPKTVTKKIRRLEVQKMASDLGSST